MIADSTHVPIPQRFSETALQKVGSLRSSALIPISPRSAEDEQAERTVKFLANSVIHTLLLQPLDINDIGEAFTLLTVDEVKELVNEVHKVLKEQPVCPKISAPAKVYGDIHGQLNDLLLLFKKYGSPNSISGDIRAFNYVFLGDYVDRGNYSLEVVILMFSLKIMYPDNVWIIRGNHEDVTVNSWYGFLFECKHKLGDEQGAAIHALINEAFDWMPLSATIGGKVFCVHGGIGKGITLKKAQMISRPVLSPNASDNQDTQDLLWSDPTSSDKVQGCHASPRGGGVTEFGPDRVAEFCSSSGIELIIRAHQCITSGYEFFADGRLLTLFSARNYCGLYTNDGAIAVVGSDFTVSIKCLKAKALDSFEMSRVWSKVSVDVKPRQFKGMLGFANIAATSTFGIGDFINEDSEGFYVLCLKSSTKNDDEEEDDDDSPREEHHRNLSLQQNQPKLAMFRPSDLVFAEDEQCPTRKGYFVIVPLVRHDGEEFLVVTLVESPIDGDFDEGYPHISPGNLFGIEHVGQNSCFSWQWAEQNGLQHRVLTVEMG